MSEFYTHERIVANKKKQGRLAARPADMIETDCMSKLVNGVVMV